MNDEPLYTSRSTAKSLWQEFRLYDDRIEFDTHFGMMVVPLAHIERVDVSESEVKGLVKGDLHLKDFRPALKLDWSNFVEHVVLDKNKGYVRRVLFSPDDPEAFKTAVEGALERYGKGGAGGGQDV